MEQLKFEEEKEDVKAYLRESLAEKERERAEIPR